MAVNGESQPLLLAVNSRASTIDPAADEEAQRRDRILFRYRSAQGASAVVVLLLVAALSAARQIVAHEADEKSYEPATTCLDVVVAIVLTEVFILFSVRKESPVLNEVAEYVTALMLVVSTSKLWVYDAWSERPAATVVIIVGGLIVPFLQMIGFIVVTRMVSTVKATLRWSACKQILRPYFIPQGLRNKIFVVLTWVVLVLGKVSLIYSPIVLGDIVSKLTQDPPVDARSQIAIYAMLNLAPNLLREVQDNLYVKVWQTAYAEVAETTFNHIHALSLEWHLKKKMGNIIRAMDRGMNGADTLMYYSMIYLFPAIGSAVAAFIVFALHFQQRTIASVCFLAFTFYCWATFAVTMWRRKFREAMNKHDNAMHDKASDSLVNFETVKCFTNEPHEVQHYIASVKEYQKGSFHAQASVSLLNVTQSSTIQLAMMGSLMVAAYCIIHKDDGFDAGEFVAVQAYVLTIFQPLSYLGSIYTSIINSMVDIQNLSDILSASIDVNDAEDAIDLNATVKEYQRPCCKDPKCTKETMKTEGGVSVEFRDVWFKYPTASEHQGIKGISFTVPAGTTTALVGSTGSGKTTISRLLFRFYDVDQGEVLINGHDVRSCTQRSVRQLIGVVPQDTTLFNETIKYNIRYGKLDATDDEMIEAAKRAQVHDFVMRNDEGYDAVCGERGLKLSGGEKQRISIARCLLKNPPVVLLDEATSALDNETEREVQRAMECLDGRTTIMIAHRLSTVLRADQIIVLKEGRIAERGTHQQLLIENGLYAAMWNMQLQEEVSDFVI